MWKQNEDLVSLERKMKEYEEGGEGGVNHFRENEEKRSLSTLESLFFFGIAKA